jgi:hypothetical protein
MRLAVRVLGDELPRAGAVEEYEDVPINPQHVPPVVLSEESWRMINEGLAAPPKPPPPPAPKPLTGSVQERLANERKRLGLE